MENGVLITNKRSIMRYDKKPQLDLHETDEESVDEESQLRDLKHYDLITGSLSEYLIDYIKWTNLCFNGPITMSVGIDPGIKNIGISYILYDRTKYDKTKSLEENLKYIFAIDMRCFCLSTLPYANVLKCRDDLYHFCGTYKEIFQCAYSIGIEKQLPKALNNMALQFYLLGYFAGCDWDDMINIVSINHENCNKILYKHKVGTQPVDNRKKMTNLRFKQILSTTTQKSKYEVNDRKNHYDTTDSFLIALLNI